MLINTFEAKTNLSKLIEKVLSGEEIIIGKSGKPVAKLVAFQEDNKPCKFGAMKGKISISEDFTDEDEKINKMFYESEIFPEK